MPSKTKNTYLYNMRTCGSPEAKLPKPKNRSYKNNSCEKYEKQKMTEHNTLEVNLNHLRLIKVTPHACVCVCAYPE